MEQKFPFKLDLTKLNNCNQLEEFDGFVTDFENGEQKIKLFQGSKELVLVVKDKKIYDISKTIYLGEYC